MTAKFFFGVVLFLATIALTFGFSLALAFPTMWLMNYEFTPVVLSTLFGIAKLTFWRAFWLNFLVSILFKSTATTSNSK
jgi:hypothetical protein